MERKNRSLKSIKKPNFKKIEASSLVFALLSLTLTVLVFGGLLFLKNIFEEDITYKAVIVAKEYIPENEIITMDNAELYFEVKNINILDTMEGALENVDSILNCQSKVALNAGEIITAKDFINHNITYEGMKNPVEISINVGDLGNSNGGKIRTGDVINLTMMFNREQLGLNSSLESTSYSLGGGSIFDGMSNESMFDFEEDEFETDEMNEEGMDELVEEPIQLKASDFVGPNSDYVFDFYAEYILQDIPVIKALDGAGVEIAPTDTASTASILVFVIEKEQELALNNALANCSQIRLSRAVETVKEEAEKVDSEETVTEESIVNETIEEPVMEEVVEETIDIETVTEEVTETEAETETVE